MKRALFGLSYVLFVLAAIAAVYLVSVAVNPG
jgi:hypothetical protein